MSVEFAPDKPQCPACGFVPDYTFDLVTGMPTEGRSIMSCLNCGLIFTRDGNKTSRLTTAERAELKTFKHRDLLKADHDKNVAPLWG